MTKLIYSIMDEDLVFEDVDVSDNSFLINNHSFYISHFNDNSKYFGFFWRFEPESNTRYRDLAISNIKRKVFKIIDEINVVEKPKRLPDSVIIDGKTVSVFDDFVNERFFIPSGSDSLCYELNMLRRVRPEFDIKEIFDHRVWGRIYHTEVIKNKVAIISFEKKTDEREDNLPGISEYRLYVAVAFDGLIRDVDEWVKKDYGYDRNRNSPPFERYVYVPFEFYTRKLVFSVGFNKGEVVKKALKLMKSFDKNYVKELNNELHFRRAPEKTVDYAYCSALNSLNSMVQEDFIEAGLPWFFDEWTRDEALSLTSSLLADRIDVVKSIILKIVNETKIKGIINAKYDNKKSQFSADAFFYAVKAFDNLVAFSRKYNFERYALGKGYYKTVVNAIEQSVDVITKYFSEGSLIFSKAGTTWMDSNYNGDNRAGYNIEINAMMLYVYHFLHKTTKKEIYSLFESKLKSVVIEKFWNGMYLVDNLNSKIVRPNVFLAYYFYSSLLSYHEWIKCFDFVLEKLWLDWGGLSSIDKDNELFTPYSTGEDPKSYHRGDSWFFINNIAAYDMAHLDKVRYLDYITKIVSASTKDILLNGALGHASEISDANRFSSRGALAQAWSAATYVELINKLFYHDL